MEAEGGSKFAADRNGLASLGSTGSGGISSGGKVGGERTQCAETVADRPGMAHARGRNAVPCSCQPEAHRGAALGSTSRGDDDLTATLVRNQDGRRGSPVGGSGAQPGVLLLHVHLLGSEDAFRPVLELARAPPRPPAAPAAAVMELARAPPGPPAATAAIPPLKAGTAPERPPSSSPSSPSTCRAGQLPLASVVAAAAAETKSGPHQAGPEGNCLPLGGHDAAARQLYHQMAEMAGPSVEMEPSIVLVGVCLGG